jgi:hypothetical protein
LRRLHQDVPELPLLPRLLLILVVMVVVWELMLLQVVNVAVHLLAVALGPTLGCL